MINPTVLDLGRKVLYKASEKATRRLGMVVGFNDESVHVLFGDQHPTKGGKVCKREELEWAPLEPDSPSE